MQIYHDRNIFGGGNSLQLTKRHILTRGERDRLTQEVLACALLAIGDGPSPLWKVSG